MINLQLDASNPLPASLTSLLAQYGLMPQVLCEQIIDRAIISIQCTLEETNIAYQQWYQHLGIPLEAQKQWQAYYGLNPEIFEQMVTRSLRIEKFKQQKWQHKLESYFMQRKDELDQVIYSLLRTQQKDLAQELFFRIQENEQSFTEIAYLYAEGTEAETGGLLGPIELGQLHPQLANLLRTTQVGIVEPLSLGGWCLLVRLEKFIPAQLDDAMRRRLLQEQFESWLQEQLHHLPAPDQVWLGIQPKEAIAT